MIDWMSASSVGLGEPELELELLELELLELEELEALELEPPVPAGKHSLPIWMVPGPQVVLLPPQPTVPRIASAAAAEGIFIKRLL
jgi:hypothetical protein